MDLCFVGSIYTMGIPMEFDEGSSRKSALVQPLGEENAWAGDYRLGYSTKP